MREANLYLISNIVHKKIKNYHLWENTLSTKEYHRLLKNSNCRICTVMSIFFHPSLYYIPFRPLRLSLCKTLTHNGLLWSFSFLSLSAILHNVIIKEISGIYVITFLWIYNSNNNYKKYIFKRKSFCIAGHLQEAIKKALMPLDELQEVCSNGLLTALSVYFLLWHE